MELFAGLFGNLLVFVVPLLCLHCHPRLPERAVAVGCMQREREIFHLDVFRSCKTACPRSLSNQPLNDSF